MKFCNNCGNKLQNNEKFCTECGVKVGTVIENNKEKKSYGNMFNNIFSYNGINVDLNHLSNKHGRNKIHAIKELRSITGISLKEAKGVIDDFYIVEKTDVTPIKIDNNNKGCLNIFLWIIFLPVMLILKIIKTEKYSRNTKILLIIASIVISLPHIVSYFSILITTPQLVLVTAIIYFIYRYKKKREAEDLEARRIKEKRYQLELERKNKIVDKTLDIIFNNKEMSNRLKEFILQHTKKYDNDQIDFSEYLKKINMFLIYINRKLDSEMKSNKNNYAEEILKYWGENEDITIDSIIIENLIESKKNQIYADHMKNIINVDDYDSLEEVINEYVGVFGENGIKELNIKILSEALDEDYADVFLLVNEEYTKVKKEYEMRRLEGELFNSHANFKDMEYIDTLSGFEFEDFLEELFIDFGYTVKDLPYSNDYGADLIISKGFNEIVIQAKNYSANVGNKAVQEVIAAKSHYKCDIGMVMANAYYTQNAIKTAEASEIILIDRDGLERIINEGSVYFNSIVS